MGKKFELFSKHKTIENLAFRANALTNWAIQDKYRTTTELISLAFRANALTNWAIQDKYRTMTELISRISTGPWQN